MPHTEHPEPLTLTPRQRKALKARRDCKVRKVIAEILAYLLMT